MTDHLTHSGAHALAQHIRDYWAKRGKTVKTRVVEQRSPKNLHDVPNSFYAVRSDMVSGLPRS